MRLNRMHCGPMAISHYESESESTTQFRMEDIDPNAETNKKQYWPATKFEPRESSKYVQNRPIAIMAAAARAKPLHQNSLYNLVWKSSLLAKGKSSQKHNKPFEIFPQHPFYCTNNTRFPKRVKACVGNTGIFVVYMCAYYCAIATASTELHFVGKMENVHRLLGINVHTMHSVFVLILIG